MTIYIRLCAKDRPENIWNVLPFYFNVAFLPFEFRKNANEKALGRKGKRIERKTQTFHVY